MQTEIILLGHGSRRAEANHELFKVADKVTQILKRSVAPAFKFHGTPDLSSAITERILSGATRIVIMPLFLFQGMYVSAKIHEEIKNIKVEFPHIEIILAKELGADDAIVNLAYLRIKETMGNEFCN